jgi:cell fate (sporulation/competence/biofilm development) regulator YlbF (YheA/YmcA/DUF963 family)
MQTTESPVIQKTRELCQTLLNEPEVAAMRQKIDTFMANDEARGIYESLMTKGQILQQKQHNGFPLEDSELNDFEALRETFLKNTVAQGFLDAQEGMQKLKRSVSQFVSKTFELGRVPEESDLESGCCGGGGGQEHGGCGCSH